MLCMIGLLSKKALVNRHWSLGRMEKSHASGGDLCLCSRVSQAVAVAGFPVPRLWGCTHPAACLSLLPVLPSRRVGARNKATGGARLVSLESDKRFLAQADKTGLHRVRLAYDHMVCYPDSKNAAGLDQAARDVAILLAGGRVAGGGVMRR